MAPVAYFALGTQSWQEAEELQGWALENARRILDERATPGGKGQLAPSLNRYLLNCWFLPTNEAGRLQVLVDAIYQFPLDLDLFFTLPLPAPCTSLPP